ncbi:hypothetical protein DFQ29_001404 [Apophysomyces sp. BC1021]|nr:hypothetical protein DFQ29_001404 [Apophysomyces sp. BC1021]
MDLQQATQLTMVVCDNAMEVLEQEVNHSAKVMSAPVVDLMGQDEQRTSGSSNIRDPCIRPV